MKSKYILWKIFSKIVSKENEAQAEKLFSIELLIRSKIKKLK